MAELVQQYENNGIYAFDEQAPAMDYDKYDNPIYSTRIKADKSGSFDGAGPDPVQSREKALLAIYSRIRKLADIVNLMTSSKFIISRDVLPISQV